jgi:hypothetical protein
MTDREYAKEALDYIKATVDADGYYIFSEKGNKHFKEFLQKNDDTRADGAKEHIIALVRDVVARVEKIKSIADDGHYIDGKKYSIGGMVDKALSQLAAVLKEKLDENESGSIAEFDSMEDAMSQLFNGGNE